MDEVVVGICIDAVGQNGISVSTEIEISIANILPGHLQFFEPV